MKKMVSILLIGALMVSWLPFVSAQEVFPQEVPVLGDLQDDGKVTAVDALLVLRHAVGKWGNVQTMLQKADVNGDGYVNALDALQMLKRTVNKPANFSDSLLVNGHSQPVRVATATAEAYTQNHPKEYKSAFEQLASRKGIGTYVEPLREEHLARWLEVNDKAGNLPYDVLEISPRVALTAAKQKVVANLNQSKTLNLSLFHPMATEYMTFGENLYGVASKATVNDPYLVFYNQAMAKEVAREWDDPALVKEGGWNLETFLSFLEKAKLVADVNGRQRVVRYGFTGNYTVAYPIVAAHHGPLGVREQGKITMVYDYEQLRTPFSMLRGGMFNRSHWRYFAQMEKCLDFFAKGEAMCMIAPASKASGIMQATGFQVGIAPLPLGENQTQYRSVHANPRVYVVPKNKESRLDVIGTWLNNTANHCGKIINANLAEFTRLGADPEVVLLYKQLLEHSLWDYTVNVDDGYGSFNDLEVSHLLSVKSFYGAVERYQEGLKKATEEFYLPLQETENN